jgi:uncharacterized protein YjbI with pentapeptide repeats
MLQTLRGEGTSRDQIVWVMVVEKGKQAAGEKQGRKPWTLREFGGQTIWDWLHLLSALAIPVVLAIVGFWFTAQQDTRQQRIETKRAQQAQKIENQRAEVERELAEQRAQDEALQAYLDEMSALLLDEDRPLRQSKAGDEVRTLANARTVTILRRLDSSRNRDILHFLREARLVPSNRYDVQEHIVTLEASNLSHADLAGVNVDSFHLQGTDFSGADLTDAYLAWSFLRNARLKGANMQGADLHGDTDLSQVDLRETDLSGANLRGASLTNADLRGANLTNAEGLSEEQLAEVKSLEGATMPNGQNYEDWLKDKKAQGKAEKNE